MGALGAEPRRPLPERELSLRALEAHVREEADARRARAARAPAAAAPRVPHAGVRVAGGDPLEQRPLYRLLPAAQLPLQSAARHLRREVRAHVARRLLCERPEANRHAERRAVHRRALVHPQVCQSAIHKFHI